MKNAFVITCFMCAIATICTGVYQVNKFNEAVDARGGYHFEKETMYDGPWLPIEFGFLALAVVVGHSGKKSGFTGFDDVQMKETGEPISPPGNCSALSDKYTTRLE
jgi:hypothetical protein